MLLLWTDVGKASSHGDTVDRKLDSKDEEHAKLDFRMARHDVVDSVSQVCNLLSRADEFCRVRGACLTLNRRVVLDILLRENRAMGAYEIQKQIKTAFGRQPEPITIYRALKFLLRQGLIVRLATRKKFVAINPGDSRTSIFLICENCGSSFRTDNFLIEKLIEQNTVNLSFRISLEGIELLGTCAQCLATK
jgi:Fur family zinc uptake transcriptional regulator